VLVVFLAGSAVIGYVLTRPEPVTQVLDPSLPLPEPRGFVIGSDSAPVEITMFGDFECPGCAQFATVTEADVRARIVDAGLARFRFMDFPIGSHVNTLVAHNAAACAGAQGKFWPMHDELYRRQPQWSALLNGPESDNPGRAIRGYARDVGVDLDAYDVCMASRQFEPQIRANFEEGRRIGVGGTPTFLIGRRLLPTGVGSYDVIRAAVDSTIAEGKAGGG
jgi:protein-disulfide isomerase